jgi:outer membrane autotransporter protein
MPLFKGPQKSQKTSAHLKLLGNLTSVLPRLHRGQRRSFTTSFHERGGEAALRGAGEDADVGYSTLGLRAATTWRLSSLMVTPHAVTAWQHALGDLPSNAALAFLSTGTGFVVAGVPLAQDSTLIDAGFDLNLRPAVTLGVSYSGQFANSLQDNAVNGRFTWLF